MTRAPVGRGGRPLVGLILGLALALLRMQPGAAHAHLVGATPGPGDVLSESPASLTLHFDSPLADSGNQVRLYRADRTLVGSFAPKPEGGNAVRLALAPLDPDLYTVGWTSVSADDGHELSQFYAFTVGPTPGPLPAPRLPPLAAGDTRVTLRLGRGDVGPTTLAVSVVDASGQPVANLQRVIVRYQPVGLDLGEDEIIAPASGAAEVVTPSFTLGLTGPWQLTVIVRRAGRDDVSATTRVTLVPAPTGTATAASAATATVVPTTPPTVTATAPPPVASPTPLATATIRNAAPFATDLATPTPASPGPAPSPASPGEALSSGGALEIVGVIGLAVALGLAIRRRQ